jgi:hypothetical protein
MVQRQELARLIAEGVRNPAGASVSSLLGTSPDSYHDMTAPPGCTNREPSRSTRRRQDSHPAGGVRRAVSQTRPT